MLLLLAALAQSPAAPTAAIAPAAPDLAPRIDSVFLDLDRTTSPGCAAGVVADGALAFADGWGSANLDHQLPVTPSTVFYMGSVSKQFTAAAVALAARQGHLSLDDDVRRWVPELPRYGRAITVRHLVHHTSGLRDYLTLQALAREPGEMTDEEIIALLARQRAPNFPAGERYLYSNSGYFLMSEIVERATGLTLRQFADRHFFRPLGMLDTHFHDDADHVVAGRATGYRPARADEAGSEPDAERGAAAALDGASDAFRMEHRWDFAQVGSGGLYSSVRDMAVWEAAFLAGAVGPPGFLDDLLQRGVLASGDTLDYAFGVDVGEYRGLRTIAHGGSLAGFRTHVMRFPDEATSVLVLCNLTTSNPGDRARRIAELVLGDRMAPAPVAAANEGGSRTDAGDADGRPGGTTAPSLTPARLAAYAGRYRSDELDATYTLAAEDGALVVEGVGTLRPAGDDVFRDGGVAFRFRRDGRGRLTGFTLDVPRAAGIVFERVGGGEE